jgi:uncharacterized protein
MGEKKKGLRVVLDTNVLLSALLFGGRLSGMVDLWERGAIVPVFSTETFDEFRSALEYPKFSLTAEERAVLIDHCVSYFDVVDVAVKVKGVCRDPNDDMFLSCALSASTGFLITGDSDLLSLGKYKNIKIILPAGLMGMF